MDCNTAFTDITVFIHLCFAEIDVCQPLQQFSHFFFLLRFDFYQRSRKITVVFDETAACWLWLEQKKILR